MFFSCIYRDIGKNDITCLSGVVFFAEYAGDKNPWIYSIEYNAYYLVPELIISCIVIAIIWKPLNKAIKAK